MHNYFDTGRMRSEPLPAVVFHYPRKYPVTWLHIIRSRWLVVGSQNGSLELRDLENDVEEPVARFEGMTGFASSGVTARTEAGQVTLVVNTRLV